MFIKVARAVIVAVWFVEKANSLNTGNNCAFSDIVRLFRVSNASVEFCGLSEAFNKSRTKVVESLEELELAEDSEAETNLERPSSVSVALSEYFSSPLISVNCLVLEAGLPLIAKGANSVNDSMVTVVLSALDKSVNSGVSAGVSAIFFMAPKISSKELFGAVKADPNIVKIGPICGITLLTLMCLISASPMYIFVKGL